MVLAGNLIGCACAALAFHLAPFFDADTDAAFHAIGMQIMEKTPTAMFVSGIISGWLIATMVWMLPSAGTAKIWVIMLMTYLVAIADLTHIVVGSVEILYLVFTGAIPWYEFIWPFALPTLAGNIFGGTFIFALISHAQIRNDMSNQNKARNQQNTKKSQENGNPNR